MTGLPIHDGYGQTETIMVCGNFRGMKIKPGSMGKPSPGVPLFVIDADGKECPPGVEGDIAILRSSDSFFGIFDGYLSPNGELDRRIKILGGRPWYLTGDRATRDEEGYFWFVGRSDDVINSSGYRIGALYPGIIRSMLTL
jgi:acyl-coenzyme A synthetase/AMP-(fatty) acid ligase